MESDKLISRHDSEFNQINELYDECLNYLKTITTRKRNKYDDIQQNIDDDDDETADSDGDDEDPMYEAINPKCGNGKIQNVKDIANGTGKSTVKLKNVNDTKQIDYDPEPEYAAVKPRKENKQPEPENVTDSKESIEIRNASNDNKNEGKEVIGIPGYGVIIAKNGMNKTEDENQTVVDVNDEESMTDDSEYDSEVPEYEAIKAKNLNEERSDTVVLEAKNVNNPIIGFKVENEVNSSENLNPPNIIEPKSSERLRKLSQQLPKIVITQSTTSLSKNKETKVKLEGHFKILEPEKKKPLRVTNIYRAPPPLRAGGYGEFPKRLVSKNGMENVALISNVPYEKIRLLNDTFHTLINLRWRWIVIGTIVVHFAIWLVFAVFWYITALAHYDFEPDPPKRGCVTGGKDFVTIFLASVEAQTTIGFGDRAIDEECPESIFLFIMQLILGTGLSGVLTCVVYAKLTRPEKLSRDGVGFSKKAVICMRDGRLCLMMRAWDLNYDHIISSEFSAHFVNTHRTKEGEVVRYYARTLALQQRQFLLWPVTLVHIIDVTSPLYKYTPDLIADNSYEITLSLKGASASMGTFTQSQTSYMPREIVWGHRFPPVVKYDSRKQKYVIDHKKLDAVEPVETPHCSAHQLYSSAKEKDETLPCPGTPSSFSEKISAFVLERSSSFRRKDVKS